MYFYPIWVITQLLMYCICSPNICTKELMREQQPDPEPRKPSGKEFLLGEMEIQKIQLGLV